MLKIKQRNRYTNYDLKKMYSENKTMERNGTK